MKSLITLILAVLLTGCVCTYLKTDKYIFERTAFGYDAKLPKLTVYADGRVVLAGYDGDVDPELVKAVEKIVVELVKKGVMIP